MHALSIFGAKVWALNIEKQIRRETLQDLARQKLVHIFGKLLPIIGKLVHVFACFPELRNKSREIWGHYGNQGFTDFRIG